MVNRQWLLQFVSAELPSQRPADVRVFGGAINTGPTRSRETRRHAGRRKDKAGCGKGTCGSYLPVQDNLVPGRETTWPRRPSGGAEQMHTEGGKHPKTMLVNFVGQRPGLGGIRALAFEVLEDAGPQAPQ